MALSFRNLFSEDDGGDGDSGSNPPDVNPFGEGTPPPRSAEGSPTGKPARPSAFSATCYVAEILPLIPPAIVSQGKIPMEKEIEIPLDPGAGGDVPLSTIYQVCPELFAAEITPLNDSTILLPAKLPEAGAAAKEGSPPVENAFSAPPELGSRESKAAADRLAKESAAMLSSDNPFLSPTMEGTGVQPFRAPSEGAKSVVTAKDETQPGGSDPEPPSSGEKVANPFSSENSDMSGSGFSEESDAPIPSGFSDGNAGFGGILGLSPLEPEEADDAGAEEEAELETESVEAKAPTPKEETEPTFNVEVHPKPETEAETESAVVNPFDSDKDFSTLFSQQAKEDEDLPFPSETKSVETTDEASSMGWGEMFFEGSGETPTESAGRDDPAAATSQPDSAAETDETTTPSEGFGFPASEGFQSPSEGNAFALEAEEDEPPEDTGFESPSDLQDEMDSPGEKDPTDEKPKREYVSLAPIGKMANPQEEAAESGEDEFKPEEEPGSASVVAVEVEAAPGFTGAPLAPPDLEGSEDERFLELRAIFSTDEDFSLSKVARRVSQLEGVSGCALATPVKLVQASTSEESRLGDEAREMVGTVRNLAKLTGLPGAKTFTIETDQGTVSLFLEADCCLAINHDKTVFGPGVREKLILITRSLHKLGDS